MSLHLEFDPHSWYMGAAIRDNSATDRKGGNTWTNIQPKRWSAYYLNGMSGYIVEFEAYTLRELKQQIKDWHKARAERDAYNRARIGEK